MSEITIIHLSNRLFFLWSNKFKEFFSLPYSFLNDEER